LKERRKERQQQSPGFSLIDLQANYVNAQKILMLIVVPYLSPYLICILMPRDWFPTGKKKEKQKAREREKKKLPGQRDDIKLVHSCSTARLISHLTNFSFVFADSNR
jgi:hypothetical protein